LKEGDYLALFAWQKGREKKEDKQKLNENEGIKLEIQK
jgi:hypothetical protein